MSAQRLTITVDERSWAFDPANSPIRIGRDASSDIVIEREGISRHHAQIEASGDTWSFRDMDSTQGSYIDGERVTTTAITGPMQFTLSRGQHAVRVGVTTDPIIDDLDRTVAASPDATAVVGQAARPGGVLAPGAAAGATQVTGETIVVECGGTSHTFAPGRKYTIGRDAGVDVPSQNPNVSRRHAVLEYRDNGWHLDDLDSSGGTFLDGRRTKTTPVAGTMAFILGDADAGERVVVKASGTRQVTAAQKLSRLGSGGKVGILAGALAVAAIAIGLVAWIATRGDDKPDFDSLTSGVVRIDVATDSQSQGWGSGTIIDKEKGLILTNAHVAGWEVGEGLALNYGPSDDWLKDVDDITIRISPGLDRSAEPKYRAKIVAADGWLDLAVLQITETLSGKFVEPADLAELTQIEIGTTDALATGDDVFVMGFPNVAENSSVTLTEGSLSGFFEDNRAADNRGWMQMNAEIRHGNSGGLLANAKGEIIGVPSRGDGLQYFQSGDTPVGRSRSIKYALPLIEAARNGTPYVSPYVTKLTGSERIDGVFFGNFIDNDLGFENECTEQFIDNPQVGWGALGMQIDYSGFVPNAHQDIWVIVQRLPIPADVQQAYQNAGVQLPDNPGEAAYVGFTQTQWKNLIPTASGCMTAAIGLDGPLLELVTYDISIRLGGNAKPVFNKQITPTPTQQ